MSSVPRTANVRKRLKTLDEQLSLVHELTRSLRACSSWQIQSESSKKRSKGLMLRNLESTLKINASRTRKMRGSANFAWSSASKK
jgi:hypothetical protein